MAGAGHVLTCVEVDATTQECVAQAWLPPPELVPALEPAEVSALLSVTAVLLAMAWGGKQLGRTTRD